MDGTSGCNVEGSTMDTQFWADQLRDRFDSYELCFIREKLKKYEAANGELLSFEVQEEEGISLRGIKNGRMAFSYTYEKGERAAVALVENTRLILPFLEEDRNCVFPSPSIEPPETPDRYEAGPSVDDQTKISLLVEMESLVRKSDRRITATRDFALYESESDVCIVNSRGIDVRERKAVFTLGGMAVAADQDEEVSWYDWIWNTSYNGLDWAGLANRIAERTVSFLGGTALDTGTYTGLLTPQAACQLLEILAPSFLAENLKKDKTRLKDREGQTCFSPLIFLVDSGLKGMDAYPFDGEGVSSRDNVVIRNGVFEGFLYDTYYGKVFGKPSTGNSVRPGIKNPPKCGIRCLYVEKGSTRGLGSLKGDLVIRELMGTHTANEVTGDFSVGAIGHYLTAGSERPFNGVILSGNIFEIFAHVQAVGEDLLFFGSYGAPSLIIEGLKISGN
jgi:PmbA protein